MKLTRAEFEYRCDASRDAMTRRLVVTMGAEPAVYYIDAQDVRYVARSEDDVATVIRFADTILEVVESVDEVLDKLAAAGRDFRGG
jgi:hypothetical protein